MITRVITLFVRSAGGQAARFWGELTVVRSKAHVTAQPERAWPCLQPAAHIIPKAVKLGGCDKGCTRTWLGRPCELCAVLPCEVAPPGAVLQKMVEMEDLHESPIPSQSPEEERVGEGGEAEFDDSEDDVFSEASEDCSEGGKKKKKKKVGPRKTSNSQPHHRPSCMHLAHIKSGVCTRFISPSRGAPAEEEEEGFRIRGRSGPQP